MLGICELGARSKRATRESSARTGWNRARSPPRVRTYVLTVLFLCCAPLTNSSGARKALGVPRLDGLILIIRGMVNRFEPSNPGTPAKLVERRNQNFVPRRDIVRRAGFGKSRFRSQMSQKAFFELGKPSKKHIDVRISYRIIELFSEGLYSSPNKAVEELVSNSWDAGAEKEG